MGDTIDINVQNTIEEVTIVATPNNYIININRVIGEQVQSDWNQNDNQEPDYIKNKPTIPAEQVNSDWNATSGKAQILNKPTIPSISGLATITYVDQQDALKVDKVAGKGLSENDFTNTLKTKLDGIESGAQVNVNADWNATSGDAEILNKPTIPSITNLVPYTGANADVNLGTNDLYSNKLWLYDAVNDNHGSIHFTDTDFHIEDADGHKMLVIEDGFMQIHLSDTIQSNLYTANLTQTRDHYLPNQSGTIALTSDITGINSGTNTGDETTATIKTKLGITTLSGSNTGDQDLSGLVVKNSPITGATKTKITYDEKGLVTAGADATTADIADSTNKRYQTDNQRTYNDATSSIQNQLNAKQNALSFTPYRYINTTQSSVTGTTSETIMATATIAANSFLANDVMKLLYGVSKGVTLSGVTIRVKINTSNTLTGATTIATYSVPTTSLFALIQRNHIISNGNLLGFGFTASAITDIAQSTTASGSTTYNPANVLYLFFTMQLGNAADTANFTMGNITN